ncbi:hypothetical protein, partial [Pseudomonas syringae group genomosp. 7]|uniref:hypothetical protein n=1 Tax=Pseudomonas syringae group genomosp. 7 TaxID=251699 RepID=UPI00376F8439
VWGFGGGVVVVFFGGWLGLGGLGGFLGWGFGGVFGVVGFVVVGGFGVCLCCGFWCFFLWWVCGVFFGLGLGVGSVGGC